MLWIREAKVVSRIDHGSTKKGEETSVSMALLVLCAEKILRLLNRFFVLFFAWFCEWCWSSTLSMAFRNICLLETANSQVTA
jgi:hypothetical protein